MKEVEESPLSVNQYFKVKDTPFGQGQYYLYKNVLDERGVDGLYDLRSKGNNLKFTNDIKSFVKGLIVYNRSMTSTEIQNAIKNKFGITISNTAIKDFRRENDLDWIRPEIDLATSNESGASEMAVALALDIGLIDTISKPNLLQRILTVFSPEIFLSFDNRSHLKGGYEGPLHIVRSKLLQIEFRRFFEAVDGLL